MVERGLELVRQNNLGAAELMLQAARGESLPDRAELGLAVTNLANSQPGLRGWGGSERHLEVLFGSSAGPAISVSEPITEWVVRLENRQRILGLLSASTRPVVQELLRCRSLTNLVVFSPSVSASGQALDAALSVSGLLLAEYKLTSGLSNAFFVVAAAANRGGASQPLEELLLDVMSLGQRFNWGQLAVFFSQVEEARTLHLLANITRKSEGQLAILFSAVTLSQNPAGVSRYLANYSQTGMNELGASLRFGAGGLNELLKEQKRPYSSTSVQRFRNTPLGGFQSFAVDCAWHRPGAALALKLLLFLVAGFLVALALHFLRRPLTGLESPLQVRGFHVPREILFALGFLVVMLLLSEPFLAQESQKADFAFRLRLPTVGSAVAAGRINVKSSFMDPRSLLTLLLFFVLQALIYTACLVKLAEIRRQRVPPRIKLRLLENEEHLFDAGLYLGFAGTIISLILVSLGLIKPSLMAAYSSTSFGIIFVSIFKIFHLRPFRRKLLLESETESFRQEHPEPARALAAPL